LDTNKLEIKGMEKKVWYTGKLEDSVKQVDKELEEWQEDLKREVSSILPK